MRRLLMAFLCGLAMVLLTSRAYPDTLERFYAETVIADSVTVAHEVNLFQIEHGLDYHIKLGKTLLESDYGTKDFHGHGGSSVLASAFNVASEYRTATFAPQPLPDWTNLPLAMILGLDVEDRVVLEYSTGFVDRNMTERDRAIFVDRLSDEMVARFIGRVDVLKKSQQLVPWGQVMVWAEDADGTFAFFRSKGRLVEYYFTTDPKISSKLKNDMGI